MFKKSLLALCFVLLASPSFAFWMWTPETGTWLNPKYAVKKTPQEQLEYADSFLQLKSYDEALREYNKLLKHYPRAREAAQAQYNLGLTNEELGRFYQAVESYQNLVDRYPFSDLGPKATERQYLIANMFLEGKVRDSRFASSLLGKEHDVVEVLRKVIKNDPYGQYAPAAQYKIGLFYLEKKDFNLAREEFQKVVSDYPDSKWSESARYQIAVADSQRSAGSQYEQKITSEAVSAFQEFVTHNPDSELSMNAKVEIQTLRLKEAENAFIVAQFYEKRLKPDAAKKYYEDVTRDYADTIWAEKAKVRIQAIDAGGAKK